MSQLSSSQRVLHALKEARAKLEEAQQAKGGPLAVIGIGCRFPGGADGPDAFWQLLQDGRDAITEVPADRWDVEAYYDPDPDAPGKTYTRHGGFLQQVDQFDPLFFNISPREAASMDPQQRLLLEVSWEALEHAGHAPGADARTGVFVGISSNDYGRLLLGTGDLTDADAYYHTGNALNAVAGRVSHALNLRGPSIAIDAACSSSLVAVHLAGLSLRARECDLALAGGVNLILSPEATVVVSRGRMLAPDGRCKTFDAAADGFVRGEGCGLVVLRRLSDAIAHGDNILAVIRGSAVSHDGHSSGFTVPNGSAHQALVRQALEAAKVDPREVGYVEAHGTGTALGDPVEVQALGAVFAEGHSADRPLLIGSVKTNIGHLEAAAGIAGLIKLVLTLQHREIPPHLHFREPNPRIPWDALPLSVPTERVPWASASGPRIGGVSSLGASGTNAHVVAAEAPARERAPAEAERPVHLLSLSARTEGALRELASRYAGRLAASPELDTGDLCFTANTGRSHFAHRLCVPASSSAGMREALNAYAAGREATGVVTGVADNTKQPKIAFLFTGQGSQYVGMGRQLYETQPTFREALDRCDEILRAHLQQPLLEVLYPSSGHRSPLDETAYTQPALFSLEYALAELWQSWGVRPSVVMGHSVGEYTAACVAGVFSLEDGLRLIAERARLIQELPRNGEMVASFEKTVSQTQCSEPTIGLVSNVTGDFVTTEVASAQHWVRHVRAPVQFAAGMGALHRHGCDVFVEIGPQPILLGMARRCLPEGAGTWLPSLRPGRADWEQMLQSLAALYVHGANVTWQGLDRGYPRSRVVLPTYPFQRERYWMQKKAPQTTVHSQRLHPLLDTRIQSPLIEGVIFESRLSTEAMPFLADHRVYEKVVVPGTCHLSLILGAAELAFGAGGCTIEDVFFPQALVIPEGEARTVQLAMTWENEGRASFRLISLGPDFAEDDGSWTLHATGRIAAGGHADGTDRVSLQELQARCPEQSDSAEFYEAIGRHQIQFGPSFRWIGTLWKGRRETLCQLVAPEVVGRLDEYQLHPGLIDSCLQLVAASLSDEEESALGSSPYVPIRIERFRFCGRAQGTELWCHASLRQAPDSDIGNMTGDVRLFDETGEPVAEVVGFEARKADAETLLRTLHGSPDDCFYEAVWQPKEREPVTEMATDPHTWLVLADGGEVGRTLAQLLKARGQQCVRVVPGEAYVKNGADEHRVNPREPGELVRLLEELAREGPPLAGVVHLWSLRGSSLRERTLASIQDDQMLGCGSGLHVVQALSRVAWEATPRLWLVTRGAQPVGSTPGPLDVAHAPLWGLGKVIALEHPNLGCARLDLDPAGDDDAEAEMLVEELLDPDGEDQIALRQGVRYVARLARHHACDRGGRDRLRLPATDSYRLQISEYGTLDNLSLEPATRQPPGPGEVAIEVRAAGLNFRDILHALGTLREHVAHIGALSAGDMSFGAECAGRIVALGEDVTGLEVGQDVIAALAIGSLGSSVTVNAEWVVPKPQELSFEEAATVPNVFLTAYYGLHHLAKIKAGDRVLIHAAAGGVGQAAVQLAQEVGAEVFATASPWKWEFLRARGIEHVMSSRTLDFADEVLAATGGQGVDIVLNSLSGEFIPKGLSALRRGGRFVEIGRVGIWDEAQVARQRPDVAYLPFDLMDAVQSTPGLMREMLVELAGRLDRRTFRPLPRTVFSIPDAVHAFRHMAQAEHIGKVVVALPEDRASLGATTRLREDGRYLITGGLGALGLRVAQWMVERGARQLLLVGRSGAGSRAAREMVRQIEQAGATVEIIKADVADPDEVARLFETVKAEHAPLRGIVHAAGVLDDGILSEQSGRRFAHVMAPKVAGSWNLHESCKDLALDFFVCFSSAAALLGSPGQGNYAAANAFMDALAHHRRALGLAGLSINWGPWEATGMAAEVSERDQERWAARGVRPLDAEVALAALDELLQQHTAQAAVLSVNWSHLHRPSAPDAGPPFLEAFLQPSVQEPDQRSAFAERFQSAPAKERRQLLLDFVRTQAARVLGLSEPDQIGPRQRLFDLGIDSLMALELKNCLESGLGQPLRSTVVFDYPTVEALAEHLAGEVLRPAAEPGARPDAAEPAPDGLDRLSEAEAEALLIEELEKMDEL